MTTYKVYPGHGVCEVTSTNDEFVFLESLHSDMNLMVPIDQMSQRGIRDTISKETALDIQDKIMRYESKLEWSDESWPMRYRRLMNMVASNDPYLLAEAIIHLQALRPELGFGERKMLSTARDLLQTEIDLALNS